MKADACVWSRRAYRLALCSFVMAAAALLVATVALLQSDWGGRLLRRAAGDTTDNRVFVWKPGARTPTPQRTLWRE